MLMTAVTAMAIGLSLAACGGSPDGGEVVTEDGSAQAVAEPADQRGAARQDAAQQGGDQRGMQDWTACMRENGVEIPESMTQSPDGRQQDSQGPPDANPMAELESNPEYQQAIQACGQPMMGDPEDRAALAACLEERGVEVAEPQGTPGAGAGAAPQGTSPPQDAETEAAIEECLQQTGNG